MEIKLQDETPVWLNYHSGPEPLYAELKPHIESLYNKGWIINSSSSYSSPVVSLRKKYGSLHQRYCQINSKTIPDRHPLLKIQNIFEN